MPCRYEETPEERAMAAKQQIENSSAYKGLKHKLDETTALLCEACRNLQDCDWKFTGKLDAWWKHHQAMDDDRIRREALAKLTPEERRALGLTNKIKLKSDKSTTDLS